MYSLDKFTIIAGSVLSFGVVVNVFLLLWHFNLYWTFDCVAQVVCYEYNKRANDARRKEYNANDVTYSSDATVCPPYLACTIAYHESKETIWRLLDAYCKGSNRPRAFIVSVDGDSAEELSILDSFRSYEYGKPGISVRLDLALCRVFESEIKACEKVGLSPDLAFQKVFALARDSLMRALGPAGVQDSKDTLKICVLQPHEGRRGARFTGLLMSLVLADILGAEMIWSTDADTVPHEGTIAYALSTLAGDDGAGSITSSFASQNGSQNLATLMQASYYQYGFHLSRSIPGAAGQSMAGVGCGMGLRAAALRSILVPWIQQTFLGHRTESNEDANLPTQIGGQGWRRLYEPRAIVWTDSQETFVDWLDQLVRWQLSSIIENAATALSFEKVQSPLLLWWQIRKLVVRPVRFAEVMHAATLGKAFGRHSTFPLLGGELLTAAFNLIYSHKELPWLSLCGPCWLMQQTYAPLNFALALWPLSKDQCLVWESKEIEQRWRSRWSTLCDLSWKLIFIVWPMTVISAAARVVLSDQSA